MGTFKNFWTPQVLSFLFKEFSQMIALVVLVGVLKGTHLVLGKVYIIIMQILWEKEEQWHIKSA